MRQAIQLVAVVGVALLVGCASKGPAPLGVEISTPQSSYRYVRQMGSIIPPTIPVSLRVWNNTNTGWQCFPSEILFTFRSQSTNADFTQGFSSTVGGVIPLYEGQSETLEYNLGSILQKYIQKVGQSDVFGISVTLPCQDFEEHQEKLESNILPVGLELS